MCSARGMNSSQGRDQASAARKLFREGSFIFSVIPIVPIILLIINVMVIEHILRKWKKQELFVFQDGQGLPVCGIIFAVESGMLPSSKRRGPAGIPRASQSA